MLTPAYCKKCGKEFYPTPEHVYKDYTGIYCCWTHFDEHRKQKREKYKKTDESIENIIPKEEPTSE